MRLNFLSLLSVVLVFGAQAYAGDSKKDLDRCIHRVRDAGCYLSNNDADRVEHNVEKCRQATDSGYTNEVFQLKESGRVVVVDTTRPVTNQYCPTTKYTIDSQGIKDFKVIGNGKIGRVFMLANSGRVYFMESDQETFEILNSKKKPYSDVREIKGDDGGNSVWLIGQSYKIKFTRERIRDKERNGELSKLKFRRTTTQRSLYRDE